MGQWGVVAVIGAFVALGLGLLVSLRKKTHE
jgi:LPXTG-motif cell wall-anchored protein